MACSADHEEGFSALAADARCVASTPSRIDLPAAGGITQGRTLIMLRSFTGPRVRTRSTDIGTTPAASLPTSELPDAVPESAAPPVRVRIHRRQWCGP